LSGPHDHRRERGHPDRRLSPLDPAADVPRPPEREVPDASRDQRPRAVHARPARGDRDLPRRVPDADPEAAESGADRPERARPRGGAAAGAGPGRDGRPDGGRGQAGRARRRRRSRVSTTESLRWFMPELALGAAIIAVIFVDLAATGRAGRRAGLAPGLVALAGGLLALTLT